MLNCPAPNGASELPLAGASSIVNVSSVSGRTCRIAYRCGFIGSRIATVISSSRVDVQIEQLQARGLEPLFHHLREPLQQLVAERRVGVALAAQAPRVEGDGAGEV